MEKKLLKNFFKKALHYKFRWQLGCRLETWWAPRASTCLFVKEGGSQGWLPNPTVNLHHRGSDEDLQNSRLCSQGFWIRICRGQVKNQIFFFLSSSGNSYIHSHLKTTHINLNGVSNFSCLQKCRFPGTVCWVGFPHLQLNELLRWFWYRWVFHFLLARDCFDSGVSTLTLSNVRRCATLTKPLWACG